MAEFDIILTLREQTLAASLSSTSISASVNLAGPRGPQGPQGDPATNLVTSVNGKQGVVVLDASDVGADVSGSAAQALQDAKDYTDTEVSTLDASLATVAKTGSYNDLSNKPTIPSIAGLATETYVDNAVAPKANTSDLGTAAFEDVEDLPVSTATQTALDAKASTASVTSGLALKENAANKSNAALGTSATLFPTQNAVKTYVDTGLATKATLLNVPQFSVPYRNTSGSGEPNTSLAVRDSSAVAYSLAARTATGAIFTATATDNAHAATKAQMDTADALKVNKAGDTMTGTLVSTFAGLPYRHQRPSAGDWSTGSSSASSYVVWNNTTSNAPFEVSSTAGAGSLIVTATGLRIGASAYYLYGTGFPNGVVTAPVGSIYIDTAITNGASSWIKKSGTGNTGWQVLEGDTGWRNVSSLLANGWTGSLYIKRTALGLSIHIEAASSSAATSGSIAIMPPGFAPSTVSGIGLNRNFVSTATGPASVYRATINNAGAIIIQNFSTSMGLIYGTMYMSTADSWPSTLPGVSA